MKLITTLYTARDIEFVLVISPRNLRQADGQWVAEETMIKHHRSKVGNMSLIFNPTVIIDIRSRGRDGNRGVNATIPMNLFYRFAAALTQVYNGLGTKGVYRDDGSLYLDQKAAAAVSRRMSLFRYSITIHPDIAIGPDGSQSKGIGFTVDRTRIGAIAHADAMALVDVLDHLDLATYTMVAGILEEMEELQSSNRIIIDKLSKIENLLTGGHQKILGIQPPAKQRESSSTDVFDWTNIGLGS